MGRKPNYLIFENRKTLFDEVLKTNPRPAPGTYYTVPKGSFIDTISLKAYGYNRNDDIVDANRQLLKSRPLAAGLPQIYPGDRLWLPPEEETVAEEEKVEAETSDEVAIRINGKIFKGWTTNSIQRSMNSIADSFSFQAPFNPNDVENSVYLDPYTYLTTDLFIGGKLYIAGRSEKWNPRFSVDSTITTIEARSLGGVIVDCTSQNKALSFAKQTLQQISSILLTPFGLSAQFPQGDSSIFANTKRNITDKIYSYLQGLSKKAGFIINSTREGGLKFERANTAGVPIMELIQGEPPLVGLSATYDGTQRFSDYIAVSQSSGNPTNNFLEKDTTIPVYRPLIFSAKDTQQGDIKNASAWERNRALAKSAKITATIATWLDPQGNLIFENNTINLTAPNIHIYNKTKLLIEKVALSETESGGKVATLTLVLPESYTLLFPEVLPWQR